MTAPNAQPRPLPAGVEGARVVGVPEVVDDYPQRDDIDREMMQRQEQAVAAPSVCPQTMPAATIGPRSMSKPCLPVCANPVELARDRRRLVQRVDGDLNGSGLAHRQDHLSMVRPVARLSGRPAASQRLVGRNDGTHGALQLGGWSSRPGALSSSARLK